MKTLKLHFALIGLAITPLWTSNSMAACTGSGLTWNCTANSTVSQINGAISFASDGATIIFSSGSGTWNGLVNLPNGKGLSLIGTSTNITLSNGGIHIQGSTRDKQYRISGFNFSGTPNGTAAIWIWPASSSSLSNLRIDNNTFSNFAAGSIAILLGCVSPTSGPIHGVLDNNTFTGTNNFIGLKILGPENWPSSPMGSGTPIFVEDNAFNFTYNNDLGSGCMDIWNGGSVVYRYNRSTNCLVTSHGVCHGGTASFEFYGNTLEATSRSDWPSGTRLFHHQGSGEFVAFDNSFIAASGKDEPLCMTHYRSCPSDSTGCNLPQCDGTQGIDGNWTPIVNYYGYPCYQQPGRDKNGNLSPMYIWNNKWSDTSARIDLSVENPWGCSDPSPEIHIKADRDYYNAVSASAQSSSTSPFNGTTGMGFGPLAHRPSTCTPTPNTRDAGHGGVGYWATDENKLYTCSAANTWTVHYTPYTYPHPFRTGSLSAPRNLRLASP
jgi:hypothetical protein